MTDNRDQLKRAAAAAAVTYLRSGMVIGLGAGTTARFALDLIAERIAGGSLTGVRGVPCSSQVAADAARLGIPLTTLEEHPVLDLTIDGADEISPSLDLIKGGGGALLHEKIVAQASRREIIIADDSKLSPALGTHRSLPVEVLPFGWRAQRDYLASLGAHVTLRADDAGTPFASDEGNRILDCDFGPISDPRALAADLDGRAGIVEHGLFLGLASEALVAGHGGLRRLTRT